MIPDFHKEPKHKNGEGHNLIYIYYRLLLTICLFYRLTSHDRGHELIRSRTGILKK